MTGGFNGLCVASFESRRAKDAVRMIERCGGRSLSVPAMREIPLEDNSEALAFGASLLAGEIDILILMTGVGTRALADTVATRYPREGFIDALKGITLVARGPKPVRALKEMGLEPDVLVPEPNTWRDLLAAVDRDCPVAGRCVAVQEYGRSNPELLEGLAGRGATVRAVPVYRWALPDDLGPMRSAIHEIIKGGVNCAVFTSANQVRNLFKLASADDLDQELRQGFLKHVMIGSIGPITSEALDEHGLKADHIASRPLMGILINELAGASSYQQRGPPA